MNMPESLAQIIFYSFIHFFCPCPQRVCERLCPVTVGLQMVTDVTPTCVYAFELSVKNTGTYFRDVCNSLKYCF